MLSKENIFKDEMTKFLNDNKSSLIGTNLEEYHLESFMLKFVNKQIICVNVIYESNKSKEKFNIINGRPIPTGFAVIREVLLDTNTYINFTRHIKLQKITSNTIDG